MTVILRCWRGSRRQGSVIPMIFGRCRTASRVAISGRSPYWPTLEQFPSRQGARTVEIVLGRLASEPAGAQAQESHITLPVNLVVRLSTTAPPSEEPIVS